LNAQMITKSPCNVNGDKLFRGDKNFLGTRLEDFPAEM